MKILLYAATRLEVQPLLERYEYMVLMPGVLYKFRIDNLEIDLLTPGIGIIPATYYLGKYLNKGDYDLAINAGICGSYDPGLIPGTVVHVTEERFPETGVDAASGFRTLDDLGLFEGNTFPFDKGILYNDNFPATPILSGLTEVSGNTVSTLLTDPVKIAALLGRAPAQVESMEGATFFFGCLLENMPAIQVRAISNFVGEQNRRKWKIKEAVKALNNLLIQLIETLNARCENESEEE